MSTKKPMDGGAGGRRKTEYIAVVWQCGMGELCLNTERPGTHDEYADAQKCVKQDEPRDLKRLGLH